MSYVYLLHFDSPLCGGNKRSLHYVGYTARPVAERMAEHASGRGARIMEVLAERGITFTLVSVWTARAFPDGTYAGRQLERRIKATKSHRRYCPLCGGRP